MTDTIQAAPPSPQRILQTLGAFHQTAALRAAIHLDLFTTLADGYSDAPAIAGRVGASEKGTRVLCDSLVVMGFLTKSGDRYGLTAESAAFLSTRLPAYLGSVARFLVDDPELVRAFEDLTAVVRKGGAVFSDEGTVSRDNPVWITFARSMAPMMAMPAELLARRLGADTDQPTEVLDIAAGHGLYGLAFARHNPRARVTAVDWPRVLEVALENAARAGVTDRYRTVPGSAFEVDFGGVYDTVLLTNFLHHFDVPTCEGLLRRLHAVTRPGGRAVAVEFVPNDDRVSPPNDAMFSLIMLATTAHGDAYTYAEYHRMFRSAGFTRCELIELEPLPQRVVVAHR